MSDVIKRVADANLIYDYRVSVDTPNFPSVDWLINPDLSSVVSVAQKFWKVVADTVVEKNQAEKDATDQVQKDATTEQTEEVLTAQTIGDPLSMTIQIFDSGLVVTTDILELQLNDVTTIVADPSLEKLTLFSLIYNVATDTYSIIAREKTDGEYAALINSDEKLNRELSEWSLPAAGTVLTRIL